MTGFENFMLEQLQPNLPKQGEVVFDAPEGITGLKLTIKEGVIGSKEGVFKLS